MGRQREARIGLGEPVRQVHVGSVGRFAVGQRPRRRLDVGPLYEPDVHARAHQLVEVPARAAEVRLDGGAETVGQPPSRDRQHAGQHPIGAVVVLRAHLDPPPGGQGAGDRGEVFEAALRVDV